MTSEGWKVAGPSEIQRRAPFTSRPMPGMSTRVSTPTPAMKSQGAATCQWRNGTLNATAPAASPTARKIPWRARK